jgi:hypothetical protein
MAKANEKTMSTEHGIAKDALLDKSIKPQNLEQEPAQETKSARDRSRGRSMGIGF